MNISYFIRTYCNSLHPSYRNGIERLPQSYFYVYGVDKQHTTIVNEEQKQKYYKDEYHGAPLVEHMSFRCTSTLMRFIRTHSMMEGRDASAIIRRLVTIAAELEGYDKNGI